MVFLNRKNGQVARMLVSFIVLPTLLGGCSLMKKNSSDSNTKGENQNKGYNAEVVSKFSKGQKFLEDENYEKAIVIFKSILVKSPTSKFNLVVNFNLGSSYEGLGRCRSAAKQFQKTARYAVNKFPRIEALSLLRLSYAYECLGKASKTAITLVDVYNRKSHLPRELALAEVPARLAGAYAQLGNRKLANKYFKQAEVGLGKLSRGKNNAVARRELLSKTLFLMGKIKRDSIARVGAIQFMDSMGYLQKYLLKSVEMGSKVWSKKSSEHIVEIYEEIWHQMQTTPFGAKKDKSKKRARVDQQVKIAELAYFNLVQLKESRFPGDIDQPAVVQLFRSMNIHENRFQMFIAGHIVGNDLTLEASKLQGIRREGRGVGRSTRLEKKRKVEQLLPKKENKDPNL